jgi:hypothetical protein
MNAMPQPSAADERADALRSRARAWQHDKLISEGQQHAIDSRSRTEWRRVGIVLYVVFFVLALSVLGSIFGFSALLRLPKGIITAVIAIAVAEVLIRREKFFGTGIESALWIGGLFAFIFGLPSQGKIEALLVFAAAAAIAGWRVLHPLFGGLAFMLIGAYIGFKVESWWAALLFCVVITIAALLALGRRIERPSTEQLLDVLLMAMPLTGYVAARLRSAGTATNASLAIAMIALTAILFFAGVKRRGRAELLAGSLSLVLAVIELQLSLSWAAETKLIAAGIALVAIASILARALRSRTSGFVVTPTALTRYDEAMQIGATIALAPPHAQAAASGRESGGGSFGGAGASGDF